MGLVGISRKNKMKNFCLPKISLLVQVGEIRYKQHIMQGKYRWICMALSEKTGAYIYPPISTDRLTFGI